MVTQASLKPQISTKIYAVVLRPSETFEEAETRLTDTLGDELSGHLKSNLYKRVTVTVERKSRLKGGISGIQWRVTFRFYHYNDGVVHFEDK